MRFGFGEFLFSGFEGLLHLVDLVEVLLGCGLFEVGELLLVGLLEGLLLFDKGLFHDPDLFLVPYLYLIELLL